MDQYWPVRIRCCWDWRPTPMRKPSGLSRVEETSSGLTWIVFSFSPLSTYKWDCLKHQIRVFLSLPPPFVSGQRPLHVTISTRLFEFFRQLSVEKEKDARIMQNQFILNNLFVLSAKEKENKPMDEQLKYPFEIRLLSEEEGGGYLISFP